MNQTLRDLGPSFFFNRAHTPCLIVGNREQICKPSQLNDRCTDVGQDFPPVAHHSRCPAISRQLRVLSFDLRPQTLRLSPEQQPFGRLLSLLASLGFITGLGPCFAVCCFHRSAASDTAAFTEAATFRSTALVFRIASVHRWSVRFPSFLVFRPALGAQPVSFTDCKLQQGREEQCRGCRRRGDCVIGL
jgi:hypothetical protein